MSYDATDIFKELTRARRQRRWDTFKRKAKQHVIYIAGTLIIAANLGMIIYALLFSGK